MPEGLIGFMKTTGENAWTAEADLLRDAAARARRYLESLPERAVFPAPRARSRAWPSSTDPGRRARPTRAACSRCSTQLGSPATVASNGGRYFGYVIGGSLPAALAAHWLASAWDQNAVFRTTSPAASFVEEVALRWVLEALGLPADWRGGFVTGTTMGHLAGLAAARHAVLARAGWDVERDGLHGAPPIEVVAGEQAHGTLYRALAPARPRHARACARVPVDGQGRMIAAELPELSGPAIVCTQAGNVDGGAFDPLPEIAAAAPRPAPGSTSTPRSACGRAPRRRARTCCAGLEDADSCAADLHKWLNVPYDNGLVLVRGEQERALRAALAMQGSYFPDEDPRDRGRWTPDASRRARGVDVWAALLALGRARPRRPRRAHLPPRARASPTGSPRAGHRRAERGRAEPGRRLLRLRRARRARVIAAHPGRRHLLVQRDALERPRRDAHQRLLVGDDRGRRRAEPRAHARPRRARGLGLGKGPWSSCTGSSS